MVRIATAEVAVHGDTKPFIADLEKLKAIVEKFDKLSVNVHAKLAKGTRASLQAQLKALKPPLTVNVKANLTGLGELRRILANHIGILGEENQLNQALQEEAKARREIANATAAQARAATAALNQQNALLRLESQRIRLAEQQRRLMERQTRIARDMRNILGLQVREWRFLGQQVFGFRRNLDVTWKAFLLNAAASETLVKSLANVFRHTLNIRKHAVQLGTIFAASFAAAAQGAGALVIGLANAVSLAQSLAGIGLIAIAVKFQLEDAEVKAAADRASNTFKEVITRSSAALKPVLIGFFDGLGESIRSQEPAFTGFFNKVSGPLKNLGDSFNKVLASEQFTELLDRIGNSTANFLNKTAAALPKILDGFLRISDSLKQARTTIKDAFGPGIFSGLSVDNIIKGIEKLTEVLVAAGPGVRAFKTAFGDLLEGIGAALGQILRTIGRVGPELFGALGPILKQVATDIGEVVSALIRFSAVVLPIIKDAAIEFSEAFSDNLSKALGILDEPLANTIKHILELGTALSPLLPIIAKIAANLEPVIAGITRIGIELAPLAVEVGKFIEKFSEGFGEGIQPFIDGLVTLAGFISDVLTPVIAFLNDHGITKFIGIIAGAVAGVLIFVAVLKSLTGIVGLFTKKDKGKTAALLAENAAMGKSSKLAKVFKLALGSLVGAAKSVGTALKGLFSKIPGLSGFISKIVSEFKLLPTRIGVFLIDLGEKISKFFRGLGGRIGGAFTSLGSKLTGPFKGIGTFFTNLGSRIVSAFAGIGPRIAAAFSGIASKITGPFKAIGGFFASIGSKIAGFFKGLGAGGGLAKLGASFGSAGAAVAKFLGPLGRVAGAIARVAGPIGIVITLILEWRNVWEIIKGAIDTAISIFNRLKTAISEIIDGFKMLFAGDIAGGLSKIGSAIWNAFTGIVSDLFGQLKNVIVNLWEIIWNTLEGLPIVGDFFGKIRDWIETGLSAVWDFIKGLFNGVDWSGLWEGFKSALSSVWNFLVMIFTPIGNFIGSVFSGIGTIVSGVWEFIKSIFSAGVAFIGSIISGIVQFFSNPIEGIKTIISGAWEFIKSIFSAGVSFIGSVFSGIGSIVSGVWDFIKSIFSAGVSAIGGILSGIGSFFSSAFSAVSGIVSGVFNSVRSIIGGVIDFIGSGASKIGGFFSRAFDTVKSAVSGAIDFVKGLIDGLLSTLADVGNKVKSFLGFGDEPAAAVKPAASAASNAAAEEVRKQSEAILKALDELGPKVQAKMAQVAQIVGQGFTQLGTTIGTSVTTISTTVATALTALATTMATNLATIFTTITTQITAQSTVILTQITTLATSLVTTLTTTLTTVATTLSTVFATLGTTLTASFTAIFTSLQAQATAFFTGTFPQTVNAGMAAFQANLTSGLQNAFTSAFAAVGPTIASAVTSAFNTASVAASSGMQAISAAVSSGVSQVIAAISPIRDEFPRVFDDAFNRAKASAQKGVDALVAAVKAGVGRIRAEGQAYYDAGAYIGQRLADGMNSKVEAVRAAANNLAAAAAAPMPHSPAKEGPLSGRGDPLYSGHAIVERLVRGIQERRDSLAAVIDQIAAKVKEGAAKAGIDVNIPSGNAAINRVLEEIKRHQDPLAHAIDRLNLTLGQLPAQINRGLSMGLGTAGALGGGTLQGRTNKNIGGRIIKQDTSASFGGGDAIGGRKVGGNLVQIRPGQVNVTLAGIRDPKAFLDELSRQLLTMVSGR